MTTQKNKGSIADQNSEDWHQQSEAKGAIIGVKILLFFNRILGNRITRLLISLVMLFYWLFSKKARNASEDYLSTVSAYQLHNPQIPNNPQTLSTFKHFVAFGNALFDKTLCWSGKITLKDVDIEPSKFKKSLQKKTEGILILGSHLGNIEVCRALAELETTQKIHVLIHTEQTEKFNDLLKSLNPKSHINLISITNITPETMIFLKSSLEQGDYVALLADRLPVSSQVQSQNHITEISFLGRTAYFPKGPFILKLLLNVPTYFMVGLKVKNRYQIHFRSLQYPSVVSRRDRTAIINDLTSQYVHHLTFFCLQEPLQWFNFYQFWHITPLEESQYE